MKIKFLSMAAMLLMLAGCLDKAPAPQAEPEPPEVTVITVEPRDTPISYEYIGKAASSRRVEIRARIDGFLEKRLYREGSKVEAGQPLFQMDAKPFEADLQAARAQLAQQQAILKTATINLERLRPLAKKKAVAQRELDTAEGSYYTAAAAVEAAKAQVTQAELRLSYTLIRSPVTGISSFAVQQEGAYIGVGSGSLLTYVAQIDPMWVELSISENDILAFNRAQRAGLVRSAENQQYTVRLLLADGSEYPYQGRITFADASISEETGTFMVRAEVPNPDDLLRPGQFLRVQLQGAVRPDAVLIPKRAVQQGASGSFVWVVDEQGRVHSRPVEPGPWRGQQWFIDSGLKKGDRVVVDGAMRLREDVRVKVVSASQADETP